MVRGKVSKFGFSRTWDKKSETELREERVRRLNNEGVRITVFIEEIFMDLCNTLNIRCEIRTWPAKFDSPEPYSFVWFTNLVTITLEMEGDDLFLTIFIKKGFGADNEKLFLELIQQRTEYRVKRLLQM